MKKDGIKIDGHTGTFYVVNEKEKFGRKIFLLESELYGDESNHLVVDQNMKLLYSEEYNDFSDYEDALESFLYDLKSEEGSEGEKAKYWGIKNID